MSDNASNLYKLMIRKGYPEEFARIISAEMNTDFTAKRMIGYIAAKGKVPLEEVADEMLAILSDRDRIINKHITEHAQNKINEWYWEQRNIDEIDEIDEE